MESSKKVSIIGVAKKAGVSVATVSRVISQNSGYSKETEGWIRKTMEGCEFTPNVNAIGLRTNHSSSIGVIVPDIISEFFARIIRELDTFLLSRHYSLLVCNSSEDYVLENIHVKGLAEKHVDGIIYMSGQNEIKEINEVKNLLVVYIDRAPKNTEVLTLSDNETGGYLTGRELITGGCTKILFLRDIRYASTIRSRKGGLIRTLGEDGISFSEGLEMSYFPEYEEARDVMGRLLREKGCFFDEIFTTGGMMVLAYINVLMESWIKVPDRVRVVGFNSISLSRFANPQITTIAQDTKELAPHTGEAVLKMIEGREIRKKGAIIPMRLIARGTA